MPRLDIAVTTLQDAINAQSGGADSVELSVDLAADGLTPPQDLVKRVRANLTIPLHVIVRPHNRDFVYTQSEREIMLRDAEQLAALGVDGLVVGGHQPDGYFDLALIQAVAATAPALTLTIHRAIDSCTDAENTLTALKGVVQRVLASGQAPTASEGQNILRTWVQKFGSAFSFVAAGKLTLANAADIAIFTGVQACHTASAVRTDGVVDTVKVRLLAEKLHSL